jgi:two-component sensor histidine kinase
VFIEGSVAALRDPDGAVRGYLKIGQDVTERRASEERQELLMREVDHRAKNALAVVQSVVHLTPARDPVTFKRAVEGRISALARAQTLLAQHHWNGADLRVLLAGELAPFLGDRRAELDGPAVTLPPGAAQPMAMAFHELATNAVKYGALSVEGGHLSVSWRLEQRSGERPHLRLRWVETGVGLIADTPERRGFGSRLLEGTVRDQLGGAVTLSWEASGLVCEIDVPLAYASASAKARSGAARG